MSWWIGLNRAEFAAELAKRAPSMDGELTDLNGKARKAKPVYGTNHEAKQLQQYREKHGSPFGRKSA